MCAGGSWNSHPALCHAYTQAFLSTAKPKAGRLLIGYDLRPSSPAIAAVCQHSAHQSGWETVNAGALPTPALAFAAQELGLPAIMITGSHIPFDRNGFKFYHAEGEITKADEQTISATPAAALSARLEGELSAVDPSILELYVSRYLAAFPRDALSGLRIGVFEHSSVARDLLHRILRSLGAETISLARSDQFVAVDTEAVRQEDIEIAPVWAKAHALNAIVTTDGDADRPLIADERGIWLRGDILGILCARELGAGSVVTPVSSNTAVEACGYFRSITRTKIGSPHVIAAMMLASDPPVVGYEANGGLLLGSDVELKSGKLSALRTRDAILPMLLVLSAARRRGCGVSDLCHELPRRHTSSDRLQDVDRAACLRLLAKLDQDRAMLSAILAPDAGLVQSIDRTDGLRVLFRSGDIVHIRPSGNAPELRCYTEASDPLRADRLCRECLARLKLSLV